MRSTGRPWFRIGRVVVLVMGITAPAVGLAVLDGPALANGSSISSVHVVVRDFSFSPSVAKSGRGVQVEWEFEGPSNHTATDTSGMGLFNSGSHAPGSTYTFVFIAAGRYPYHCSIHPTMTGTVGVPIKVPPTGTVGVTFLVTWSSARAPAGFVFDVQVKKPGATKFTAFKTGVIGRTARFTPARVGTYRFRARMRRPANHAASQYSVARSVVVA